MKILLISTQPTLSESLAAEVKADGCLFAVANENDADGKLAAESHDVIVVEPGADDDSILSLIPIWRRQGITAAILVLLEESVSPQKRVRCLDLGADVVLNKPIPATELLARLRALARRQQSLEKKTYQIADLELDPIGRTVRRGDRLVRLTPREFELLEFLISRRGKIVSRSTIREHLFDNIGVRGSNVVDVYVRYLRKKLDKGAPQALILTHWGKGYEFRGENPGA